MKKMIGQSEVSEKGVMENMSFILSCFPFMVE